MLSLLFPIDYDNNFCSFQSFNRCLVTFWSLPWSAESLFERPPEVAASLQSAEFLGPLQYRTWRKMTSICQPGTRANWSHDLFVSGTFLQQPRPPSFSQSSCSRYSSHLQIWWRACGTCSTGSMYQEHICAVRCTQSCIDLFFVVALQMVCSSRIWSWI